MEIRNKISKTIILSIIFIFSINIIVSYAARTTWKSYSADDYKNALSSDAGSLQGYLDAVNVQSLSEEDLEQYIKCVNAFASSEGGRFLDAQLMGSIKTKSNEANTRLKEIRNGSSGNSGSNSNDNIYNKSWGNYVTSQDKIANASTREEAKAYYEMLANPNPDVDNMSDWFAEQYIIMINKLLNSPGFALYEQENPSARKELTDKIREANDEKNITDSDALDAIDDSGAGSTDAGGNAPGDDSIYRQPKRDPNKSAAGSLDDMIGDADSFVQSSQTTHYSQSDLQKFSQTMFNIGISIGTAIALIVGIVIGVKYMIGSAEAKADYKKMLIPYLVGCIVVFGAFGIWRLVITIAESM